MPDSPEQQRRSDRDTGDIASHGDARVARLVKVADHIESHADEPLTLASLAKLAALSPARLQKQFKEAFGVSPKAYQDAVRMRRFKQSLKDGRKVTDAIFASGFGSVSRVYGEANRSIGMPPRTYRAGGAGEVIVYAGRTTALGLMMMAATDRGVCFVEFGDDEASLVGRLRSEFPKAELTTSPARNAPELDAWMEALDQHISAGGPRPDLPLDMRGT